MIGAVIKASLASIVVIFMIHGADGNPIEYLVMFGPIIFIAGFTSVFIGDRVEKAFASRLLANVTRLLAFALISALVNILVTLLVFAPEDEIGKFGYLALIPFFWRIFLNFGLPLSLLFAFILRFFTRVDGNSELEEAGASH